MRFLAGLTLAVVLASCGFETMAARSATGRGADDRYVPIGFAW